MSLSNGAGRSRVRWCAAACLMAVVVGGCAETGAEGDATGQGPPIEPKIAWPLLCERFPPGDGEIVDCARQSDDFLALRPGLVRSASPEAFLIEGALYYANASGRSVPVHWFDNGPDPFVEGLARSPLDGRFGFVDEQLELVVPRVWDFAFPFEKGFARVCRGCDLVPSEGDGHSEVAGGSWGWIDVSGKEVVPVEHVREKLPDPR